MVRFAGSRVFQHSPPSLRMDSGLPYQLLLLLATGLLNFCQCVEDQSSLYTIDSVELNIGPSGTVESGTPVTLRCEVSVSHDPQLHLTNRFYFVQNDIRVSSLNTSEASARYQLDPARAADSGKYECLVEVEEKSRRSVPRELIVKGLQTPVLQLSNTTLFEGVEITAVCTAPEEKGSLLFYFYQESRSGETKKLKQVTTSETKLNLRQAGDSYLYCDYDITTLPEAGRSNTSNKVQVIVRGLHISPVMNVLPSTTVFEGDVIEVVCKVVDPPARNVEVFLNKDKRVLKKASVSLSHLYVVESGDSGEFVCKAEWGSTQKETREFVRVKDLFSAPHLRMDPIEVFEGEPLILSCSVPSYASERISNESMKFSIYRDGRKLTQTETYSTTARFSINGNYTCQVEVVVDQLGQTFRKDSEMVVLKARVPVSKPMLSVVDGRLVVGKPFLLRCHSQYGSLPITYRLMYGPLQRTDRQTVDIRVVSRPGDEAVFNISAIQRAGDVQKFLCHASNNDYNAPMASSGLRPDTQIIEPVSKPMLTLQPNTGVATEGQDLTIVCSVQRGTPPINFTWYHTQKAHPLDTKTLDVTEGSYVIKGVRGEDEGGYYCVGNNQANDSKRSSTVAVGVKQAGWKKGLIAAFCILLVTAVILVIIIKKGRLPLGRKRTGELSVKSASTKAERLSLTQAEVVETANVTPGVMGRNVWSEHVSGSESDDQNSVVVVPLEEPETQYTEVQTRPVDPNRAPVKKGTDTVYSEVRNSKQGASEQADSGSVEYAQLNRDIDHHDHHNHNDHGDHDHSHSDHGIQGDHVDGHIVDHIADHIDDHIDDIVDIELAEGGECNGDPAPDC